MCIVIFSRPRNSCKTSELIDWCNNQENSAGILMPDVNGLRKMYDIQSKRMFDAEHNIAISTNEALVRIGNFNFYQSSFDIANDIIEKAINQQKEYVLIDEVGKLELNHQGFYKSVNMAVQSVADKTYSGKLILTVRDILLEKVLDCFGVSEYTIVNTIN